MIFLHRNKNLYLDCGVYYSIAAQFLALDGIQSGKEVWSCVATHRVYSLGVMNGSMKTEKKRKWQNALASLLVSLLPILLFYDQLISLSVQINLRPEMQNGHLMAKGLSYTTKMNFAARLRWKTKKWRPHKAL
jgi:hypothetical protein